MMLVQRHRPHICQQGRSRSGINRLSPAGHQTRLPAVIARSTPKESEGKEKAEEDLPPWVRSERERELQAKSGAGFQLPWPLALLGSVLVAIAATGSIFEYVDRNPLFGVLLPDNPLWAPILLGFAITGFPTCGFLFKYGVDKFNEEAERQDKIDGYLPRDRK